MICLMTQFTASHAVVHGVQGPGLQAEGLRATAEPSLSQLEASRLGIEAADSRAAWGAPL